MSLSLFNTDDQPIRLEMQNADVLYYPNFFTLEESNNLFNTLLNTIQWQQDDITVFGKTYPQPRLTALYANNNIPYKYSNITMHPKPFTKELIWIKEKIENIASCQFTGCLLNLYRTGKDSNGWHSDDEKELGEFPVIASLSLGQARWFHFKHKSNKKLQQKILLEPGSLLIMKGETQKYWLHQIPKTSKKITPRINLTFRVFFASL
ncbi:alpha-ketoglutarate-dependent dioxygenase AlkB [Aquimarina sp. 2201CG1-2-11]|uniref:alpha-ketoglutarate-dependent dioxygenase AlkB family protein n=1 Tax=Aquimarina discodermiae TaxID=3231043 RepID=UPI0034636003